MKKIIFYLMLISGIILIGIQVSCESKASTPDSTPMDLSKESLIPQPVSVIPSGSSFEITAKTQIFIAEDSPEIKKAAQYFANLLNSETGFNMQVKVSNKNPGGENFYLKLSGDAKDLGDEGYDLNITEDLVTLSAKKPAGLFWGIQTIRQLLPSLIESKTAQTGPWKIPTGSIHDHPEYSYRGSMLDVSRHFFSVKDVKRYIDFLAAYKMNVLHLHLTDDQGWRIEIMSWPNLTAHGGSTEVGGGKGGFYSQEDYKEIVNYAQDRHIMIIPEIDMPGHTNAALASYPELNCDGKSPKLYTGTEVGFSTLCNDKEITFTFIDDVIRELAAITPGPYIHMGGDESHVTKMEDYIPFVNKVQDIINKHGKQMIGWDEVVHGKLKPTSVAQYWAKAENAQAAVKQNAKVIISPATKAYLDMQYDSTTHLGLHWAAYIEVDSAYIWDPATLVPGISKKDILGIEAPLWSETITNMDEIEYMVFPRLPGYAEIGWSPASVRNWDTYKVRLAGHQMRFEAMGIDFYKSKLVPWKK